MVTEILLLGDSRLYLKSEDILLAEIPQLAEVIGDLHDTLVDFRKRHGVGRAIAAPQIGFAKRLIYMNIDRPMVFINPILTFMTDEMFEVMDDCMSFPHLLVKVQRCRKCKVDYYDEKGCAGSMEFENDLAELIQHEYDHLDGILATMRAVDKYSFYAK